MKNYVLAAIAATSLAGAAQGALIGELSLFDEGVTTTAGPVDVYHFTVTTTDGEGAIQNFDFTGATGGGFTGSFLNNDQTFRTSSDLSELNVPGVGVFTLADTFFVSPVSSPTSVQVLDDGSALEASYAFAASPVDASSGYVAAVFSVEAGAEAPTFNGGFAVIDGLDVEIVPEPSSLALLGLGGLLIARRRRG